MNRIQIICVGKLKESYLKEACDEYSKRLSPFCKFSIIEIPECRLPDSPSLSQIENALSKEGEMLIEKAKGSFMVSLCIEGKQMSSKKLSEEINKISVNGDGNISFIIGSSFGLSDEVKEKSKLRLSMSEMTFPHQLARVMLCEQIYRAFQILNNGKYHK